ncbi:hypothetical protein QQX98_012167 [Neonectria punicea]|uniref:Heterokaryon incompatibility domain-containing protein n=1 Tax=Neonectria punicea TaxID=979145 RepID=A0ABR1GJN8_9HYPO
MASRNEILCGRCADIDIDKIFSGGYETPHLVIGLGRVPGEQLTSSCALCRLVAEAVHRPYCNADLALFHDSCGVCEVADPGQEDSCSSYQLFAVETTPEKHRDVIGHSKWFRYVDTILPSGRVATDAIFSKSKAEHAEAPLGKGKLANGSFITLKVGRKSSPTSSLVAYSGSIYPAFGDSDDLAPTRMIPHGTVDWTILRSFLADCQRHHSCCSSMAGQPLVNGLRFIDCKTKQLRQAMADDEYVALSYVWGEPDKKPFSDSDLIDGKPPQAPRVIEDAIKVVVQMGYRYLWVDSYQEDQFSVRQLIFGSHQVSFNCMQGEKSEIFTSPASWNANLSQSLGERTGSVWSHIGRFSRRNLTYDHDALNALKATMNAFNWNPEEPTSHLWGIPFADTLTPLGFEGFVTRGGYPRKVADLVQSVDQVFGYGLAWGVSEDAVSRRRDDFPTWSWASVDGHINYTGLRWPGNLDEPCPDPELNVSIEDSEGQTVPISTYLLHSRASVASRYLHLDGWSIRDALTLRPSEGMAKLDIADEKYELQGRLTLDHGEASSSIYNILSETRDSHKSWEALVVWIDPRDWDSAREPFVILLVKVDDLQHPNSNVYERVGCIRALYLEKMPRVERRDAASVMQLKQTMPLMKWAADLIGKERRADQERKEELKRKRAEEEAKTKAAWQTALEEGWDPSQEGEFRRRRAYEKLGWRTPQSKKAGDNTVLVLSDKAESICGEADTTSEIEEPHAKETEEPKASTSNEAKADAEDGNESDSEDNSESIDSSDMGDEFINTVMSRGRAEHMYRYLPIVRRSFIIR